MKTFLAVAAWIFVTSAAIAMFMVWVNPPFL